MVLHTWTSNYAPTSTSIVSSLAAACRSTVSAWVHAHPRYLFPVKALGKVFRGKFLDGLRHLYDQDKLFLLPRVPGVSTLAKPECFYALLSKLRHKPWVVYSKAPFASPAKMLAYLGPYTHRVAFSNQRLLACDDGLVCLPLSRPYRRRSTQDRRTTRRRVPVPLHASCSPQGFLPHPPFWTAGQSGQGRVARPMPALAGRHHARAGHQEIDSRVGLEDQRHRCDLLSAVWSACAGTNPSPAFATVGYTSRGHARARQKGHLMTPWRWRDRHIGQSRFSRQASAVCTTTEEERKDTGLANKRRAAPSMTVRADQSITRPFYSANTCALPPKSN